MAQFFSRHLPFLATLSNYTRADIRGDALAGLTTAVMLIPQGMAYAMLAGLPPIVGLYASTIPLAIYALLGTSRELAVGPVAMVSLLVATGLAPLADGGTELYVGYAVTLALMVGALQLIMGVGRLGFLVNFLSHPVISGFTSAAALIIGFSQLKHLLGINIPRSHHVHEILINAARGISQVQPQTLVIGVISVMALLILKRVKPGFPAALTVVIAGTVAVWGLSLEAVGVQIVGEVPAGLPAPVLPTLDPQAIPALMPMALTIALVGFMESISVAKSFASRRRYEVRPNQELIALGMANLVGSLFRAYPVTGGFSRTAVNAQAGARTSLAALITAALVALTLLFLTPLFHYLPKAVLAAIIMTAVFGLVDVKEVRHLWRVKRGDLALLVLTFIATLTLGIEPGILIGVVASLLWFVVRTTRPHVAVLGRVPGTCAHRNIRHYPEAERVPGVLSVRIDAQFYFGNVSFLKETLTRLEAEMDRPLKALVIDASSINQLDSSADTALHELWDAYAERGIAMSLATVKRPVMVVMERSGLAEKIGPDHFFMDVHSAVEAAA